MLVHGTWDHDACMTHAHKPREREHSRTDQELAHAHAPQLLFFAIPDRASNKQAIISHPHRGMATSYVEPGLPAACLSTSGLG